MKKLLIAALLSALAPPALAQETYAPQWVQASEFYINVGPPRQYIGPVFVNSYTGAGGAAGSWQLADLTGAPWSIPVDATAAKLRGIVIITGGNQTGTADIGVVIRAVGDTRVSCTGANYTGQAVFQTNVVPVNGTNYVIGGGERSGMATWVPLTAGKFEWCWTRSTPGQWPSQPSYGVNLSVESWAR